MKKFQFLDKRDSNGLLLGYSITEFSYNLAEQCLSKIKTYDTYQHLINFLPKKYVDIYFKKLFYEATLPLAGQVAINNWHLENDGNLLSIKINAIGFPSKKLLESVWSISNFNFEIINDLQTHKITIKDKIWPYYNYWLKYINFFNSKIFSIKKDKIINNITLKPKNNIAVNYIEGHNFENRNDLFWLK